METKTQVGLALGGVGMALLGALVYLNRKQKGEVMELFGLADVDESSLVAKMKLLEQKDPASFKRWMESLEKDVHKIEAEGQKEEFKKVSIDIIADINNILSQRKLQWVHIRPVPTDTKDTSGKPIYENRLVAFQTQDGKTWGSYAATKPKPVDTLFVPGVKRAPAHEEISDEDLKIVERHMKKQRDVESRGGKYPLEVRLTEAFNNQGKRYSAGRVKGIIQKWRAQNP